MKIGIIGTSRITNDHISVLKKLKHNIAFISSTRKKSLNLLKISRKHKIKKKFYNWNKAIDYAKKLKDCNFLITSRIKDNFKILYKCTKLNRFILVEKPVFLNSRQFNKIKFNKKIFVGYNRIFFNVIIFLKKKLASKKNLNVIVKCPESNKAEILKNSCHIISILSYIFGDLKLVNKRKNSNFINCTLTSKNRSFIYLSFNFKNSDNFLIEIYEKKIRYLLSPIEQLKIFSKVVVKKNKNNFLYSPKLESHQIEYKNNNFKPGFKRQMKEFENFTKGKKIINNFYFSKKIIEICEKIAK